MVKRGARSETQREERFAFKAESEVLMDELYDALDDDVNLKAFTLMRLFNIVQFLHLHMKKCHIFLIFAQNLEFDY